MSEFEEMLRLKGLDVSEAQIISRACIRNVDVAAIVDLHIDSRLGRVEWALVPNERGFPVTTTTPANEELATKRHQLAIQWDNRLGLIPEPNGPGAGWHDGYDNNPYERDGKTVTWNEMYKVTVAPSDQNPEFSVAEAMRSIDSERYKRLAQQISTGRVNNDCPIPMSAREAVEKIGVAAIGPLHPAQETLPPIAPSNANARQLS